MSIEQDNVKYFNEVHKTNYTKAEIEGIYWLCDIYKLKTADGISYSHNCHNCGKKIDTIGNEFCCPDCKINYYHLQDFSIGYQCYWGKECKMCTKAYKTNGSNYSDYELAEEEEEDELEYSDDLEEEDEPLLSLKKPEIEMPLLERSSNYISSDEDDSLLCPKQKSEPINSLDNTNSNVFQENIIDLMIRLYGPEKNNK